MFKINLEDGREAPYKAKIDESRKYIPKLVNLENIYPSGSVSVPEVKISLSPHQLAFSHTYYSKPRN